MKESLDGRSPAGSFRGDWEYRERKLQLAFEPFLTVGTTQRRFLA